MRGLPHPLHIATPAYLQRPSRLLNAGPSGPPPPVIPFLSNLRSGFETSYITQPSGVYSTPVTNIVSGQPVWATVGTPPSITTAGAAKPASLKTTLQCSMISNLVSTVTFNAPTTNILIAVMCRINNSTAAAIVQPNSALALVHIGTDRYIGNADLILSFSGPGTNSLWRTLIWYIANTGGTSTMTLYQDGIQIINGGASFATLPQISPTTIGYDDLTGTDGMSGQIAEVLIYDGLTIVASAPSIHTYLSTKWLTPP